MTSIAARVEQVVIESAFLTEGMVRGLINLSELARQLQPQLEKEMWKPVGQAAVVMALTRLAGKLQQREHVEAGLLPQMAELTTRSELTEFTYRSSATSRECQGRLLAMAESHPGVFVTVTQGLHEVLIIVGRQLVEAVESCFAAEQLLAKIEKVSALTLRLDPEARDTPGIYHAILKKLALVKVNVVDMICTYSEMTLVLERSQVGLAFSVLSQSIKLRPR
ncbi:hypothetical protein V8J88_18935 [Massilia sp. W12]|uniref:hypothetical protein n=1 Tax=Massilia sp. W12 TaxID=3126507 RepID=UPI0030CB1E37